MKNHSITIIKKTSFIYTSINENLEVFLAERGRFTPFVCRPASRRLVLWGMARPEYSGLAHILISKMFFDISGGEREIRTPVTLRQTAFRELRDQPLCHLSLMNSVFSNGAEKGIWLLLRPQPASLHLRSDASHFSGFRFKSMSVPVYMVPRKGFEPSHPMGIRV